MNRDFAKRLLVILNGAWDDIRDASFPASFLKETERCRTTGKLANAGAESLKLSETQIAGTDALVVDGKLHIYSLGTRVATAGDSIYVATGREVMRKGIMPREDGSDNVIWQTPCTAEAALIIAGDHVLTGADGQVTAFETETGKEVWSVAVDGEARGLAVANGQLIVSTTAGKIYPWMRGLARNFGLNLLMSPIAVRLAQAVVG